MTTLFKKLSITGGAIAVLVALIVNVGVNQNSQFDVEADPIPGTYTRTLNGTLYQFSTITNSINSFEKYAGTNTRVLLQNTTSRTWTNLGGGYNRLPVTFSGTNNGVSPSPSIMIEQIQNIRTVVANFSTTGVSVNFVYDYLIGYEGGFNVWSGQDGGEYEIQSGVSSDTVYSAPLKSTGYGVNSRPDRLIISFPFDTSTFTSLTITYDC
jgi:hypothetical protein